MINYKILSSLLATRIKEHLSNLIHPDQTGFLKGKFIGKYIRKALEMVHYAEDITGLILTIDFEKAFYKLEWGFIFKTLKYYNFGEKMTNMIKLLYEKVSSCINNG